MSALHEMCLETISSSSSIVYFLNLNNMTMGLGLSFIFIRWYIILAVRWCLMFHSHYNTIHFYYETNIKRTSLYSLLLFHSNISICEHVTNMCMNEMRRGCSTRAHIHYIKQIYFCHQRIKYIISFVCTHLSAFPHRLSHIAITQTAFTWNWVFGKLRTMTEYIHKKWEGNIHAVWSKEKETEFYSHLCKRGDAQHSRPPPETSNYHWGNKII